MIESTSPTSLSSPSTALRFITCPYLYFIALTYSEAAGTVSSASCTSTSPTPPAESFQKTTSSSLLLPPSLSHRRISPFSPLPSPPPPPPSSSILRQLRRILGSRPPCRCTLFLSFWSCVSLALQSFHISHSVVLISFAGAMVRQRLPAAAGLATNAHLLRLGTFQSQRLHVDSLCAVHAGRGVMLLIERGRTCRDSHSLSRRPEIIGETYLYAEISRKRPFCACGAQYFSDLPHVFPWLQKLERRQQMQTADGDRLNHPSLPCALSIRFVEL